MSNTHMGQRPSEHVTLEAVDVGGGDQEDLNLRRIHPDGTRETSPFSVPASKVLVVTDVDWQYNSGDPKSRQTFRIFIRDFENDESHRVFESTIILNDSGDGGISEGMTSGFVLSSKGTLQGDVSPGGGMINHIIIRGYLCRES
jgi:hypothetical protein